MSVRSKLIAKNVFIDATSTEIIKTLVCQYDATYFYELDQQMVQNDTTVISETEKGKKLLLNHCDWPKANNTIQYNTIFIACRKP